MALTTLFCSVLSQSISLRKRVSSSESFIRLATLRLSCSTDSSISTTKDNGIPFSTKISYETEINIHKPLSRRAKKHPRSRHYGFQAKVNDSQKKSLGQCSDIANQNCPSQHSLDIVEEGVREQMTSSFEISFTAELLHYRTTIFLAPCSWDTE